MPEEAQAETAPATPAPALTPEQLQALNAIPALAQGLLETNRTLQSLPEALRGAQPQATQPAYTDDQMRRAGQDYLRRTFENPLEVRAQELRMTAEAATRQAQAEAQQQIEKFRQEMEAKDSTRNFFAANPDLDNPRDSLAIQGLMQSNLVNRQAPLADQLAYAASVVRAQNAARDQWVLQQAEASKNQAAMAAAGLGGNAPQGYQQAAAQGAEQIDELSERKAQFEANKEFQRTRHAASKELPPWRGKAGRTK